MHAAFHGHDACVQLLLSAGAHKDAKDNVSRRRTGVDAGQHRRPLFVAPRGQSQWQRADSPAQYCSMTYPMLPIAGNSAHHDHHMIHGG